MRKLLMFVGSALALSFYLNCNASLASNNIQKNENDMDITSPKHNVLKENKIEFDDEEMNKSPKNKIIEENKIEEEMINEDIRKEKAGKAASERVKKRLGLNKENTGGRTKHSVY